MRWMHVSVVCTTKLITQKLHCYRYTACDGHVVAGIKGRKGVGHLSLRLVLSAFYAHGMHVNLPLME